MKLALRFAAVVAALALVLATLWNRRGPSEPATHAGIAAEAPPSRVTSELPAVEPDASSAPARVEERTAVDVPQTAPKPTRWTPTLLRVRLVSQERGEPVADDRVALSLRASEEHDLFWWIGQWHGKPGQAPFTNAQGFAEFAVEPHVEYRVWTPAHQSFVQGVDVGALSDNEEREIVLTVPTEPDRAFFGYLVDHESGMSIPGGVIRVVRGAPTVTTIADGLLRAQRGTNTAPGVEVRSDGEGEFDLQVRSWEWPRATVEADGYARQSFALEAGHETRERAFEVALSRVATLEVFVRDATRRPVSASVEISGGRDQEWNARTDDAGRIVFEDVPADTALQLTTRATGRGRRAEPESIRLDSGERRVVEVNVDARGSIHGRVEDELGQPLLARVQLSSHSGASEEMTTNELGHFRFDGIAAGRWHVALDWSTAHTLERERPDALMPALNVDVPPDGRTVEATLRIERGLFIEGVVVDHGGQPVEKAVVSTGPKYAITEADGQFRIGPLKRGTYSLRAQDTLSRFAPSESIQAEASDTNIVLHVSPGAAASGRVLDGDGQGRAVEFEVIGPTGSPESGSWFISSAPNGEWQIGGLPAGTYEASVTTEDGWWARRTGLELRAGAAIENIDLVLQRGATLLLRCTAGPYRAYDVLVGGDVLEMSWLEPGDSTTLVVPAGEVLIRWRDDEETIVSSRTLTLAPGERRDVTWSGRP